ncbi:MAG: lipopolysaccharide heptosyltransferase II [Verrucomicrobiota bacterium]|nr:lipopolysaccharide heptosyltransferase II [Verrucomicrobiota bacterium]
MLDFGIYLLVRAGSAVIASFPLKFLFRLGNALGYLAWLILPQYRRLAQRNVAIAFGDQMPVKEQRRLLRRHFARLGANLLCSVKLASMPFEAVAACVEIDNLEAAEREARAGHAGVVVLSHLGNWEALAQLLPSLFRGVEMGTIYQKLGNRYLDEYVRAQRGRAGVQLFDRSAGYGKVVELLRKRGGVGVLSDQHAGDRGLWTPFFGRLASTSTLPALLTKRTGASMLSAALYTVGPGKWRITFTPRFDSPEDTIESLTAKANDVMEEQIRNSPEDWFWVHNRWKTPTPSFLLTRYKRGFYLPPKIPASQLKPFRILIRATNWLGDSIISAPAIRAINRGRPDAHVTILAPAKIAAVWKLVPEVDDVIALPGKSLLAAVRLIRSRPPFDVGIIFPKSLRAALEMWFARLPRRVGYRGHHRSWLLNQIVPDGAARRPPTHEAEDYLEFAKIIGASPTSLDPPVDVPPNRTPKIGICPGAEYGPAKRWLPERFSETARIVAKSHKVDWMLFGTPADAQIGEQISTAIGQRCTNRSGKTTLEELIAELRDCCLLLTNDTGTMHLATLLGVPVVAIFGSTEPRLTGPLGAGHRVIRHHVECSPCFLRECPIDFRCMHAVTAAEVAEAVLAELERSTNLARS